MQGFISGEASLTGGERKLMAGLFSRIFGKRTWEDEVRREWTKVYDPKKDADRLGVALLMTLRPQLELLDLDIGIVPTEGVFISETCRGYLFGLAHGLLLAENVERNRDSVIDALIGAFGLVYGDPMGREWAALTEQEVEAGNTTVIEASKWAVKEVEAIYQNTGATSPMGFYCAVNGMI
ncbi:MAG: hypothetical protein KKA44_08295 [Alphaproteobacteria bacterium]|nr:hypothetical protein [Alphaproteobacteria bacterium]MBU0866426.1 hypothetical protein [Alphaproteobacteria bacterium]MBU1824959.1 hypothetical protein [Alphaproteobacteria bacterium]